MDSGTAAVEISGVSKHFGDVKAVDDISLSIADGEFFAMLGPSGCGKTTTLRMIAGLDFPTMGSLKIFGDEVGTLPPNKRPVNTVFQNYALFPHMNVVDNVAFGLKMKGVNKASARTSALDAIELVRLGGMESRRPGQLSGGQQQRVALARALVNEPKVLLLDEPLGALDLKLRQEMQGELKSLQRELGVSFVFVTHDQEEALTMSDRIAVMHEGQLLQVGTPEEIYERPANRFVADFIGQTNLLEATVEDGSTVCLANGARVAADSDLPAGTKVALCLRPERAVIQAATDTTAPPAALTGTAVSPAALTGTVAEVTYLGNALVYQVKLDWMQIEVRAANVHAANSTDVPPLDVGQEVTVSWEPKDAALVVD